MVAPAPLRLSVCHVSDVTSSSTSQQVFNIYYPASTPIPPKALGYEYQFVPLALEGRRIHREIPVGPRNFGNPHGQQMAIQTFSPPYDDFPDVFWHIHPFFVIQSAWEHFSARVTELTPQQRTIYAHLFTIVKLLEEMVDLPVEEETNDTEEDETEEDDDQEDETKEEEMSVRKRSRMGEYNLTSFTRML